MTLIGEAIEYHIEGLNKEGLSIPLPASTIYTHFLNRGGKGVHSPADQLGINSDRM